MASAQELVSKGFQGYQGWGDAEAAADFAATGGAGKGGSAGGGGGDINSQIQKAIGIQQQAAQPYINSLQQSIPETKERFEQARGDVKAKETNLKSRYDAILGELSGKEEKVVGQQELATTQEFGKRGFLPSGGNVQQELINKTAPIRETFGNILRQTGLDREEGLLNLSQILSSLTGEETSQLRDIQNTIGQTGIRSAEFGATQGLGVAGQQETQRSNRLAEILGQAQFEEDKRSSGITEAQNAAIIEEDKRANAAAEALAWYKAKNTDGDSDNDDAIADGIFGDNPFNQGISGWDPAGATGNISPRPSALSYFK